MKYDYAKLNIFTKSQVNGLTKSLSGLRFGNESNHAAWNAIFDQAKTYGLEIGYSDVHGERLDFTKSRKLTREQSAMGKTWLKEYFFKANGDARSGKRTEYVSQRVLHIAKNVSRFEFVGVQVLASNNWFPAQIVPIYRAFNRRGQYFDYSPVHWGQPIIMESN